MATTPIVAELTKAELDALVAANGLNEGLQYKVTDKNWLLLAKSENMLLSVKKYLSLNRTESVPEYIDSEFIMIDTGVIDTDISVVENYLLVDTDISNYIADFCILDFVNYSDSISNLIIFEVFDLSTIDISYKSVIYPTAKSIGIPHPNYIRADYVGINNSIRLKIALKKYNI